MKVALLQMNVTRRDAAANIAAAERLMQRAGEADLYVLPEMWATGFDVHPDESTFSAGEQGLAWMREQATGRGCSVAGSLPVLNEEGKPVNRFFGCIAGQAEATYDKRHPFAPGGEAAAYEAGRQAVNFPLAGMTLRPQICYDLRFPELVRQLALQDISILFVAAAWPVERIQHWDTLLRARAIENQFFVVAANGISSHLGETMHMGGGSAIYDPWGSLLAQGSTDNLDGEILHANLQPGMISRIRSDISIFKDRRPELYKLTE